MNRVGGQVWVFVPLILLLVQTHYSISLENTDTSGTPSLNGNGVLSERLRQRIDCNNKELRRRMYQKGRFWVVENFAKADHGQIDCHSTITYATISDLSYLDNLLPLVRRWRAPISLTLYAPGRDLHPTIDVISYLRNCLQNPSDFQLIRRFVSFHLFFEADHIKQELPLEFNDTLTFCDRIPPMELSTYRSDHNLSYYINIPRNVARDAAITHFILTSDIELYPSENLVSKFLRMIAFDERPIVKRRVYVLPTFEVTADSKAPTTKSQLIHMLQNDTAVEFHVKFCEHCSKVPEIERWKDIPETNDLKILTTVKRMGDFVHWEPFFIGTSSMPYYEERHVYEGKSDRMTQAHIMCLLDYDFSVLDSVFLVHHPGIKLGYPAESKGIRAATRKMINEQFLPEYASLFGHRDGCHL